MPVFRVFKSADYTTMSNRHLRDKNLSLKAKGLQSMLLSLPEWWKFSVRGLAEICREGKSGITGALQELERNGYLVRRQTRQPDGRMGNVEYWIYETPQEPCPGFPDTGKPDAESPEAALPETGQPEAGNQPQIITNRTKTERTKHERIGEPRHRHGQYENVLLTDDELAKLQTEFPSDWQGRIERLSEYMASTGKSYKNHLATLRSWARRERQKSQGGYSHENYQCGEEDSL